MPDDVTVSPDSDIDAVIKGLHHDVGQFIVNIEKFGQNRLHITSVRKGPPVYSENILDYMALAGWVPERTDTEVVDGREHPVMEFVRGDKIDEMIQRRRGKFETLDLDH